MNEIEFVESVKVLEIKPGDLIVIKVPVLLTTMQYSRLKAHIKNEYPDWKFVILDGGADIGIIRGEFATGGLTPDRSSDGYMKQLHE